MINRFTDRTIINFGLWLIVLKPIFDLDWRWPLLYLGTIPILFHRIVAFAIPTIITVIFVLRLLLKKPIRINSNILAIILLLSITITLCFQRVAYSIDEYFRTYSFFIIFFFLPSLISSELKFFKILKLLIIISLIPTLISYLQVFGLIKFTYFDTLPDIGHIGRVSGGYYHPTGYLNYLIYLIPVSIYLYANKIISKRFFWSWLLFTLPMVGRSLHRATIILVIFQLSVFIFFFKRIKFKYFLIFIFCTSLLFSFPYIWKLINIDDAVTEGKFRGRSEIWSTYLSYFNHSEFSQKIFGFGSPKLGTAYEPHSDWLRIMFNYGYFGLASYILFLSSIFFIFFVKFQKTKQKLKPESVSLVGLVLVITLILYSITMEPLRYSNFSWGAAIILGYAYMMTLKPKVVKL